MTARDPTRAPLTVGAVRVRYAAAMVIAAILMVAALSLLNALL